MTISEALNKGSNNYLQLVTANFDKYGISVSGDTLRSFHAVMKGTGLGFQILAASHAFTVEYGRGPTTSTGGGGAVTRNIMAWLEAKGLWQESTGEAGQGLNPYAVSKTIHIKGTRLYRGVDPRYPGKTQSGVLTGPIKIMSEQLRKDIAAAVASDIKLSILNKMRKTK